MTLLWLSRQTRRLYKPPVCVISVVVYHITTSHAWKHLWWEPDSLSTHYSSVNAVWTEWGVNKSMISDEDTPICLTLGVLWRCINVPCKLFIYPIKGNESDWTKEQVGVTFPKKRKKQRRDLSICNMFVFTFASSSPPHLQPHSSRWDGACLSLSSKCLCNFITCHMKRHDFLHVVVLLGQTVFQDK